jgi:hypothetical protein
VEDLGDPLVIAARRLNRERDTACEAFPDENQESHHRPWTRAGTPWRSSYFVAFADPP